MVSATLSTLNTGTNPRMVVETNIVCPPSAKFFHRDTVRIVSELPATDGTVARFGALIKSFATDGTVARLFLVFA
jgi:hypothetical protein